ncbi:receptor-transporting protein 4-like [Betta splendens]|uniref:Receptor-transporting protein 4-like n=1 Tax=Betta splendens TaxID=158456 RepID=A0A6P7NZQ9_BETSP|nr:receptor-transporting protein 4-like [Betta splendens]
MSKTDWNPSLWLDVFDELVYDDNQLDNEDSWTLNFNYNQDDTVTKQERKRGWKVYCHCGFGKFRCGSCSRTWGSARVVLLFRYRLRQGRGTVIMRPFGQTCLQCRDDEYDLPGFAKKDVEKALFRLFAKIRKNCYGEEDDNEDGSVCSTKVWTKPHEAALCEACSHGICCQDES